MASKTTFKRLSFWNVVILSESSLKCHPICVLINMTVSRTHKSSKAFKRKLSVIEPWKITGKRGNKDVIVSFVISLHWAHNNTFWLVTTLDVQKKALLYKGGVGDRKCMLFFWELAHHRSLKSPPYRTWTWNPKFTGQYQNPRDSKNANICS